MARAANGTNGSGKRAGQRSAVAAASSPSADAPSPRALAAALVERAQFASRAGLSFQTSTGLFKRDLNEALGYKRELTTKDYRDRYERGGIAERIVEAYPRATWAGGADVQEDPDPGTLTSFEEAIESLSARLDVWARFMRADILSGLGRYSVILIGAPGDLATELPRMKSPDDVLYLTPLPEDRAPIIEYVSDTTDPRFGLPAFYNLKLGTSITKKTHWSRVIHIAEGLLEDDVYGKPRLRSCWNYLDDLAKIIGGGAEAAWKRMDPGMQLDIDPEINLSSNAETALSDEVDEYLHGMRRVLRTRGAKVNLLSTTVAGFGENSDSVLGLISATTGIPQRILSGSERGELASSQDRDNWSDRVVERRREFAVPAIRQLIDRLVEKGALAAPAEYTVVWNESDELDEQSKAEVVGKIAMANQAQTATGDTPILSSDEIRDRVYGIEPLIVEEPDEVPSDEVPTDEPPGDDGNEPVVEDEDEDSDEDEAALVVNRSPDPPKDEPQWRAARRASDAHRAEIAAMMLSMWTAAANKLDGAAVAKAAAQGNRMAAERLALDALTQAEIKTMSPLREELNATLASGGRAALQTVKKRGTFIMASSLRRLIDMSFNATNDRALAYGATRSSALITEITEDTRAAVRAMIAKGIAEGWPPRRLVQLIRQRVGLRSDQMRALENFVMRGATEAQAARYAKKLRKDRALLIARTETLRASNAGQKEMWLQASEGGLIDSNQKRVWISTPDDRTRPDHRAMDGQIRGINEPFRKPDGTPIEPGEEPNCRCAQGLATPEDMAKAGVPEDEASTEQGTISHDRISNVLDRAGSDRSYASGRSTAYGDELLSDLADARGYSGVPDVLDQAAFDAAPGTTYYRGVGTVSMGQTSITDTQLAEQFRTGECFYGHGIFGNGIYTTSRLAEAEDYGTAILRMKPKPGARIINGTDLERLIGDASAKANSAEWDRISPILNDPGRAAAYFGYDAFLPRLAPDHYLVIINRSAFMVLQ